MVRQKSNLRSRTGSRAYAMRGGPTLLSGMLSGDIQIGWTASSRKMRTKGFVTLADLSQDNIPIMNHLMAVKKSYLQRQPEIVEKFCELSLRAYRLVERQRVKAQC